MIVRSDIVSMIVRSDIVSINKLILILEHKSNTQWHYRKKKIQYRHSLRMSVSAFITVMILHLM